MFSLHALIRETIYASILSEQKKRFHEKIGFIMEKLFYYSLPEHFEILAGHFTLGENFLKRQNTILKNVLK